MFLFGPPKNSLEGWTLFSYKNFLLFQEIYIHIAAHNVCENDVPSQ